MQLSDFNFDLPDELIARYPLDTRSASRLLHLDAQGQRLIKDGKTLETPEENLHELNAQAVDLADKLPILKALQLA